MDLSLIFTIPGKPGLFKLVNQGKNNSIVESLLDKKRTPVFNMSKISSLAEIAIYTYEKDMELAEIFRNIFKKENGGKCISHNEDAAKLRAYFLEILPNFHQERVYDSNIKKVFQWYNLLLDNKLVDLELSEREKALLEENKKSETKEDLAEEKLAEEGTAAEKSPAKKASKAAKTATDSKETASIAKKTKKETGAKTGIGSAKKASAKVANTKVSGAKTSVNKTTARKSGASNKGK
ncbi:MAG: DUF5606 domain-containing protein [Bacteroidales bacterium]